MDMFKTRVGEARFIMINEDNFFTTTSDRPPYRAAGRNGSPVRYAVCPACDNPIVLVGLYRREGDGRPRRPYGKHCGHDVPGLAVYDERAYRECKFANPDRRSRTKRKPSDRTARALYEIMRTRFDRVEYAWRQCSGIRLSGKSLRRALEAWRDGRAWLNYDATYHNLPQMLFWGGGVTSLYGQSVLRDGPVAQRLAHAPGVVLEPCPLDGYVRVGTRRFVNVDFSLGSRKTRVVDDHLEESYLLRVSVDGRRTGADIPIIADPERFDAILNMNGWHDNACLLDIASSVL